MYCEDASTSGTHFAQRIGFVCGEPRDRSRWNVYCRVQLFFLRRAIELLHPYVR